MAPRSDLSARRLEAGPDLAAKVTFLARPESYPEHPAAVEPVETHMAWVFLAGERVYKLKKPVRYDYLDFSTLELRRRDSEREVRLNRRLAPDVYLGTVALTVDAAGELALGGEGEAVDWLVLMRRLPADRMLDRMIRDGTVGEDDVRRLGELLGRFYRAAPPVPLRAAAYRRRFRRDVEAIRRELLEPRGLLAAAAVEGVARGLLAFVTRRGGLLDERVAAGRIVEAHGDLRPEHVWLGEPPAIIDCLEFRREFRLLDPADELAFLGMECERLGAAWIGARLFAELERGTGDRPPPELVAFYGAFRAYLRAKLAFLHIREPELGRTADWVRRAATYLELAAAKLPAAAHGSS